MSHYEKCRYIKMGRMLTPCPLEALHSFLMSCWTRTYPCQGTDCDDCPFIEKYGVKL